MGVGFIHDKLKIKYLILYVMSRVNEPIPMPTVQEITMIDGGFDYFSFAECLNELVEAEQLRRTSDDLYWITPNGVKNGAIFESSLPYTVRLKADQVVADCNKELKRQSQVKGRITRRENGTCIVELSLDDDEENVMRLHLMVADEKMAKDLVDRFKRNPEKIYSELISTLFHM